MTSYHICYVETGYPHPHGGGGAGTYVQLVGRELVRRGYKVSVVSSWCPDCQSSIYDEGVTIYRPKLGGALHWYLNKIPGLRTGALATRYLESGWRLYRFLERLHARDHIDVVEFTEGGDFWHAWRSPFPYLVHLHGSRYTFRHMSRRPVEAGEWYHRRLELFFIRQAKWVISPSRALLDIVTEENGQPFKRSSVLPYPLDPRLLRNCDGQGHRQDARKIVFFAARNDPVKGGATLLEAVPLVQRLIPQVEFRFFGYEPDSGTCVPDGVRCYPFLSKDELLKQYQYADLCVIPSIWDNSPNTVYEAMAAGKVVVASRVGGIPELVEDGETGILVDPGNPNQLAEAIVQLLEDNKTCIRMGEASCKRVQKVTDLKKNVDRRLQIYHGIINEWPEE